MIHPTLMPGIGKYVRTYALVSHLPWGAAESSVFTGADPAVANGDISAVTVTDPGLFEVDLTSTGVIVIDTNGSTARQSFFLDVYDLSLRQWYGDTIEWVNNARPTYDGTLTRAVVLQEGQSMSPINMNNACSDADGDALTYTLVSGSFPPGITLSPSGHITGTP